LAKRAAAGALNVYAAGDFLLGRKNIEREMTCNRTAAWLGVFGRERVLLQAVSHLQQATSAMPVQPKPDRFRAARMHERQARRDAPAMA
jgi:hypothetical protein